MQTIFKSGLSAQHRSVSGRVLILILFVLFVSISTNLGTNIQSVSAAASLPCDLYGSAGTPCVAAHSTIRALFGGYSGNLYQVQRASDSATTNIGTLSTGGYANAAAQDAFCSGTTCIITIIYDQTSRHNDLHISPGGGAAPNPDSGAIANALPLVAGGNHVYGLYVTAGVGYRDLAATGTAVNGQAEGMYMVTSGTHVNNGCCFDYGNTEQPLANDTGNGHMDAVYFGLRCEHPPCTGAGPWVAGDLENGLFQGNGSNTGDQPVTFPLVTAMLKNNGQTTFALKTGNAQSGGLTTQYNGTLPTGSFSGYTPMHQEGGIVLGVGGDNSNGSAGTFLEGVMTSGYPTDAADNSVQSNIVSVGYALPSYTQVVPTSETTAQSWRYTTGNPGSGWQAIGFNDSGWSTGNGGFGTSGTPGAVIGTTWSTADIWLRRHFNPGSLTPSQISGLLLRLHHDEDIDVYINGVAAFSASGYTTAYDYYPMSTAAQNAVLVNADNVLAFHVHQTTGGQYGDVGIATIGSAAAPTYTQLVPTSEGSGQSWRYTTANPGSGWQNSSFGDSGWSTGNGGFGTSGTPGAVIGTTWNTADIWLRRHFNPGTLSASQINGMVFRLHHDEDVDVYINGVAAYSAPGYLTGYAYYPISPAAQSAVIANGDNVLAFHVHQTTGGQYGDVGIFTTGTAGGPTPTFIPPTVPPSGLSLYWKFDETSGTTASDSSGNNYAGTTFNGPAWVPGHTNYALSFNGSNQYVASNSSAIVNTSTDFSVCAWVNLNNLNGWQTIVSEDGANVSGFFLQYSQSIGNVFDFAIQSSDSTSSTAYRAVASSSPAAGGWYHLCGVRSGSNILLYVNGALQQSVAISSAWAASGKVAVGRGLWGAAQVDWVNGNVDQVRIYNRALSASDVSSLYSSGQ
jgi:hypothetical protein